MTPSQKIICKAIAKKIKNGAYGDWETDKENILKTVREEYNLTDEMVNYIVTLLDGENK